MNPNDEICVIKCTVHDLIDALASVEIEPTEKAISAVINEIKDNLTDLCIDRGYQIIEEAIARKPWL
jgi:hypothetical protein